MKASDLMIGDWVYNKHHKRNIQITPYDFFTHGHLPTGKQYFVGEPELVSGRNLEPILLTPEILEKIGFVKYIAWQYVLPKMEGEILVSIMPMKWLPNTDNRWLVAIKNGYTDAKIAITYVHELQQALKLCGIEEEIVI